jgi:hypothetical protein
MFLRDVADVSKHIPYKQVSYVALVHHICSMLIYELLMLRLMQCKCPKSKPNTWGVTRIE